MNDNNETNEVDEGMIGGQLDNESPAGPDLEAVDQMEVNYDLTLGDMLNAETPDAVVLQNTLELLKRVHVSTQFVQDRELPIITHQTITFSSNDKYFTSKPVELDWPLQFMPLPEAFKNSKGLN